MSYKIGQFRRDSLNGSQRYLTNISYQIVPVQTTLQQVVSTTFFTDYALNLSTSLTYGKSYYVKIGLKRQNTDQTITINLRQSTTNDNNTDIENNKNIQVLDTITIPKKLDNSINNTAIIEVAFSPNATYNQIMLTLQRTANDFSIQNEIGTSGRLIEISETDTSVSQIFNILNILTDGGNLIQSLKKIGVQGPPGLLMCINGQDIRIGPSGIYEIKNDYKITSIGFVIEDSNDVTFDKRNYFILDYQY